jgi:hypothetical protein
MGVELKTNVSTEFKLPEPVLPVLDLPEAPDAGVPEGGLHMSCNGDFDIKNKGESLIQPPISGQPRVLIGIPILTYSHEFAQSFLKFWTQLCLMTTGKIQIGYHFVYRKPVHMAEIEIVDVAQFNKCTHILFMDDDVFDVTVEDLQKLLAADKDVISGVMYASKFPYAMCCFRRYNVERKMIDQPSDNSMYRLYEIPCNCTQCGFGMSHWDAKFCPVCGKAQDNLIQKVDLIPFPFTLMKVSIFDKIKKPWFHCTENYPTDSWFADRCIEAGIQEYAHMGVRLNHNGVTDATKPFMFQMEMEKKKVAQNNGLVVITEQDMEKHQFLLHNKMKEAEEKLKPKPVMVGLEKMEVSNVSETNNVPNDICKEEGIKVPN